MDECIDYQLIYTFIISIFGVVHRPVGRLNLEDSAFLHKPNTPPVNHDISISGILITGKLKKYLRSSYYALIRLQRYPNHE